MSNFIVLVGALCATSVFAADAKGFALNGDAAKGEATYKIMCVTCHGEKGKGDGPGGAALTPKPADFTDATRAAAATDEYIYNMVKNGGAANGKSPMMIAWGPALGDDQKVRDVAAFVRTFSKSTAPAAPAAPVAAPAKDAKAAPKKK